MKRFRWALALPFLLFLQFAYAGSITTFNLSNFTYYFGANLGGDNAGYAFGGPGIYLTGGGSASCAWCSAGQSFSPGAYLVPDVSVDFESSEGAVMVGGQWYQGPYNVVLFVSSITAQGFTFPAGGKVPSTFTVTLPASFGLVQGEVGSGALFDVNVPSGELVLTFDYYPAGNGYPASYYFANAYYKAQGIAGVPEPGAIFLMATGLAGMVGVVRRKRGRLPM